ncbi:G-type lectin S-receptor-like serine/threonine-protein kinase SD2-5 [Prunus yedoensis var. nudiflora]|uniref:G-type lectin S-receptor-like serine/threonine-protein kinase SD2-5 n=1 Tax=Prunus yedoensis var. nudiflora TaxID=2094558 RepID=A0A314XV81_PRUYE|nr:G-type lectin S-receptor-like serine/threonine-protein kinase SD2-5 [Prunus yedoensis var. nudiflora]
MNREESGVHTTLRGTRGYLPPEWITNYAISEKSDVYSYVMVFLESIGGKRNFDPGAVLRKGTFLLNYAFKAVGKGKYETVP